MYTAIILCRNYLQIVLSNYVFFGQINEMNLSGLYIPFYKIMPLSLNRELFSLDTAAVAHWSCTLQNSGFRGTQSAFYCCGNFLLTTFVDIKNEKIGLPNNQFYHKTDITLKRVTWRTN